MSDETYKYWAFISYSHQDRAWGDWLHRAIETYQVPSRLVGKDSVHGPIPKRLFPVFRDRDELPSSANLGDSINLSLSQSRYQIVICSPRSAASRWVNEEVKYFKSIGRADRVLCLIVDGEPNASDKAGGEMLECFCPALRHDVTPQGVLSERRVEAIAADARTGGDGRGNAKLKLLAGLLGISYDDLKQRERQRQRVRVVSQALIGIAVIGCLAFVWQLREQQLAQRALDARIGRLQLLGERELAEGHSGRAATALAEAYALGDRSGALRRQLHQAMQPFDGRESWLKAAAAPVNRIALSGDGKRLVSVAGRRWVEFWDVDQRQRRSVTALAEQAVSEVRRPVFSPDGRYLYLTTENFPDDPVETVRVFEVETGRETLRRQGSPALEKELYRPFDPSGTRLCLVLADQPGVVQVLSLPDGAPLLQFRPAERVRTVSFSNDGRTLLTGGNAGQVALWDARTGQLMRSFVGITAPVVTVAMSDDGQRVIAGAGYGPIKVWDAETGALQLAGGQRFTVNHVRFSQDGSRYFSIADDGLRVWDADIGALIYSSPDAHRQGKWAALSPDGETLGSPNEGPATLWDVYAQRRLLELDGHAGGAVDVAFSREGKRLATAGQDGSIGVWRTALRPAWRHRHGEPLDPRGGYGVTQAAYTPEGDRALSVGTDGTVLLRNAANGEVLTSLPQQSASIEGLTFSRDGKQVLLATADGSLHRYTLATGALRGRFKLDWTVAGQHQVKASGDLRHALVLNVEDASKSVLVDLDQGRSQLLPAVLLDAGAAFDPASTSLAVIVGDEVQLRALQDQKIKWRWPLVAAEGASLTSLAYAQSGQHIAVTASDGSVFVLDAASGTLLHQSLVSTEGRLRLTRFSPDGTTLLLSDDLGHGYLWSMRETRVLSLFGHSDAITSLDFNTDGETVLTASTDGTARLWSRHDGAQILLIGTHSASIESAAFNPEGSAVLTGSADNSAAVWDIRAEQRPAAEIAALIACRVAWRVQGEVLLPGKPGAC